MRYMLILLLFSASNAFGTVYSWVDARGTRHFANREYDIPERYRAKAKALYPEPSDTRPASQSTQVQQKSVEAVAIAQPTMPVVMAPPVAIPESQFKVNKPTLRKERRSRRSSSPEE